MSTLSAQVPPPTAVRLSQTLGVEIKMSSASHMKELPQLVARWLSEAVQEVPPESAENVKGAFQSLGQAASTDLVALYEQIGGMQMMDNNYFRLWPLSEIREENASPSPQGVLFADYLLDSWRYRIKPISEGESMVYVDHCDGKLPLPVGKNLQDFLRCCLSDPDAVLHHPGCRGADA